MPHADNNWRGIVFVWDEKAIFIGRAANATLHESPAIKVCASLEGEFGLKTGEGDEWMKYDSAIIPPGRPHAIDGRQNRMVMLLLAPETDLAGPLVPLFSNENIIKLMPTALEKIRRIFAGFNKRRAADEPNVCGEMVAAITARKSFPIDPRVAQSIEWIRERRDEGISVQEIASGVELSESRFSHLFTENVRVSVRRYLLWLRLRDAMHIFADGKSLTETAHEAGFSDSAHLTRTFRSLLGIAPSALTKESSIISFLK